MLLTGSSCVRVRANVSYRFKRGRVSTNCHRHFRGGCPSGNTPFGRTEFHCVPRGTGRSWWAVSVELLGLNTSRRLATHLTCYAKVLHLLRLLGYLRDFSRCRTAQRGCFDVRSHKVRLVLFFFPSVRCGAYILF